MPAKKHHVFLFDVDGVIVNPVAYRIGITYTLRELGKRIGLNNLDELLPTEHEVSAMEAQGVHDVWDITNIIFALWLTEIAINASPIGVLTNQSSASVVEQLQAIGLLKPNVVRPDYLSLAKSLASTSEMSHPPDIALKVLSERLSKVAQGKLWIELIEKFLIGTRSAYSSYGTRLFQNIILGTHDFEKTYDLVSEYTGVGLLRAEDITLISKDTVAKLLELNSSDSVSAGIYTARPSLPPKDAKISPVGFSPEAEIAIENAGMQSLPLIAMGMMEWLGKQVNERTEDLTKPNSTQALSALLNTINGGKDVEALTEGYAVDKQGKPAADTQLALLKLKDTTIFVFEDTISGIVPLLSVAEFLRHQQFQINVVPLGIATNPEKKSALSKHCQSVFANVNDAFHHAITQLHTP